MNVHVCACFCLYATIVLPPPKYHAANTSRDGPFLAQQKEPKQVRSPCLSTSRRPGKGQYIYVFISLLRCHTSVTGTTLNARALVFSMHGFLVRRYIYMYHMILFYRFSVDISTVTDEKLALLLSVELWISK